MRDRSPALAAAAVAAVLVGAATMGGVGDAAAQEPPAAAAQSPGSKEIAAKAAPFRRSLRFQILDRTRGLPRNRVQSVVQDATGFIWLATTDGLARWDGRRFTTFRHDPADPTSLSASNVSRLLVARDGTLWVGTAGGGVDRYRPEDSSFQRLAAGAGKAGALQAGAVLSMSEGPDGRIWIGTAGGGLAALDPKSGAARSWSSKQGLADQVSAVRAAADGTVWVGTGAGLFRLDSKSGAVARVADRDRVLAEAAITALTTDRQQNLWIGTARNGLARHAPGAQKVTWYPVHPDDESKLMDGAIGALLADRTGHIWVGATRVLHRLDPASGRFERYPADPTHPRGLPDTPLDAFEDAAGVIWIATQDGGAALLDPRATRFRTYNTPDAITALSQHGEDVWFASSYGACRMRRTGSAGADCYAIPRPIPILVDRSGTIFVGTENDGLYQLVPGSADRWVVYQHNPDDPGSLAPGSLFRLLEDRRGNLWLGSYGGGLQRFDRATRKFVSYALPSNEVYMIREDAEKDATFWIGTVNLGLLRVDLETGAVEPFAPEPNDAENRSDNAVTDFVLEQDVIWMATYGGGLKRYDRRTKKVKSFRRSDGMPSDTLYALQKDASGKLWLSSTAGLVRFDPASEQIHVFTADDGLQADEFTLMASFVAKDGSFVFGGLGGITFFEPGEIDIDRYQPPIALTSIRILGEPYRGGTSLASLREISLAHDQAFVEIEFAALSFSSSRRTQFEYQVGGASDRWHRSEDAIVNLAGLDDGDYDLVVRARNRHGVESKTIGLRIQIAPPLWRSRYALIGYGVALIGLLFGAYRYQKARIVRLQKLARLAVVERDVEVTAAVQSWFLPEQEVYSAPGCELAGFYRGAEKCSGDWWWYEEMGEGKLWVLVADVTGHGAGPAMLTAAVAMGIWVQAGLPEDQDQVVDRLTRVNREVLARCKGKATMTMTAVALDRRSGEAVVYGLGGLPAVVMGPDGKHAVVGASGTPIGSVGELTVGSRSVVLGPHDWLIITTDGIVETTLANGRPLGFRRFVNAVRDVRTQPLAAAVGRVISDVDRARARRLQEDDFTFCIIERRA